MTDDKFAKVMGIIEQKFPQYEDIIMLFEGGSAAHGGTSPDSGGDTDVYGVYIERPRELFSPKGMPKTWTFSTGSDKDRNTADDIDITIHPLRKLLKLLAGGNPTMLHYLFAKPLSTRIDWLSVINSRDCLLASSHANAYLGYSDQQRRALEGKKSRYCNRKDIIEKHGYDTKYAMHTIRLLMEASELLLTGNISLPSYDAKFLRDIRNGKYVLSEILYFIYLNRETVQNARKNSVLDEDINWDEVASLSQSIHLNYWSKNGWIED